MILFERRACAILFNLLRTRRDPRPWLLPVNICTSVPETFVAAEQPFEYVDIDPATLEIDPRPSDHGGVLFARAYGKGGDRSPLFARLKEAQPDLFIVDDRCLSAPDVESDELFRFADLTLFSTGRAKYVDLGGGGFAHADESLVYERHLPPPETSWEEHRERTLAAREVAERQKRTLNHIYTTTLPPEIQFPPELQQWRFHVSVPEAERLLAAIFEAGLFASRHYAPRAEGFPAASALHERIVNLFNDRYFDEERAHRTAAVILRHLLQFGHSPESR